MFFVKLVNGFSEVLHVQRGNAMTSHVVFVGLALVLCTAVPSANTSANSNPEVIVGTKDVILIRKLADTQMVTVDEQQVVRLRKTPSEVLSTISKTSPATITATAASYVLSSTEPALSPSLHPLSSTTTSPSSTSSITTTTTRPFPISSKTIPETSTTLSEPSTGGVTATTLKPSTSTTTRVASMTQEGKLTTLSILKSEGTGHVRRTGLGSTAIPLPSTVAQLLQLHKTQELLRQAAVVARIRQKYIAAMRVFYQTGDSEADLPECTKMQVCNKVDVYSTPWVERQCRCPGRSTCSKSVDFADGHSVSDKTRLYKTCEPVKELPECQFFREPTWTVEQTASNVTRQTVHCTCPKNSAAYLFKYELVPNDSGVVSKYTFACSPQVRPKCQQAEPCRLFTVKKRRVVDEVNSDTLCDCAPNHWCPTHHTDNSITPGSFYKEDNVRVFTGFCRPVGADSIKTAHPAD